jgi:periplasmic protein CpxP/Spy
MVRIILLGARLPAAASATALMLVAVSPARATLTEVGAAPGPAARSVLLAQAPAPPETNVETNIAELHQRLQISAAQEPQFEALANIMRQNARTMSSAAAPPSNPNAVEGLRLAIQYGQEEINGMRRLLPALQALYTSLSPAQRQTADMIFRQGPGG